MFGVEFFGKLKPQINIAITKFTSTQTKMENGDQWALRQRIGDEAVDAKAAHMEMGQWDVGRGTLLVLTEDAFFCKIDTRLLVEDSLKVT